MPNKRPIQPVTKCHGSKPKPSKFANKRTTAQVTADRLFIKAAVKQGYSERGITDWLNRVLKGTGQRYRLSRSQVHLDIKAMGL